MKTKHSGEYKITFRKTRSWTKLLCFMVLIGGFVTIGEKVQAGIDFQTGLGGFEPHNAVVNPNIPSQVVVMQGCTILVSNDFGQNFPITITSNTSMAMPCNGDPSLAFDSQGNLFVSHLSRIPELTVFAGGPIDITTNGTYTPTQVSVVDGNNDDKQWLVADANEASPFRDNLYLVWSQFVGGAWQVTFSRSTDSGTNWSAPQILSTTPPAVDDDGDGLVDEDQINGTDDDGDLLIDEDPQELGAWPSHIAVGPNGDVYIAYHSRRCGTANGGTIPLLRDGLGGANFAAGIVPQVSNAFGPGQATVGCNRQFVSGNRLPGADFWLQGSKQPWVLPDPVRPGHVYVIGNDDPNDVYASGDDADVVIARSNDFGTTFAHGRVDHSPGQSFSVMPTAHIDQDGNIGVTWYDNRRNLMNTGVNSNFGAPNFLLDLYGTTSNDGGQTFVNDFRINDAPFDPDQGANCRFAMAGETLATNNCTSRIGEYNGFWTVDGLGYATWTGNTTPPVAPFPADGVGGQDPYFDLFSMRGAFLDRLEPNESVDFAVVADLGTNDTYNEADLSIHSHTDLDFFKVVPLHSGKLGVAVQFNERISTLDIAIQDAVGNEIIPMGTGTITMSQPGSSVVMVAFSAVQGETYFVEVLDENAPAEFAPQSTYDLTIVNRSAPVPFGLDLISSSDSGSNHSDNVTNDNTPSITIRLDPADAIAMGIEMLTPADVMANNDGYAVAVFDNGAFSGRATPANFNGTLWNYTFSAPLSDGAHSITTKVEVFDDATSQANNFGMESDSLLVMIDSSAPLAPSTPDLLASSDSAGINDDDVTTITNPIFVGTGEANALIRIKANVGLVGQSMLTSGGAYQVTVDPLIDEVYDITAELEDLAGNVSAASAALKVTIANQVLNLEGDTTGPANMTVEVDLDAGTVAGYPGVPNASGLIGIVGIPLVTLDVNSEALTIQGTTNDDSLHYSPNGNQSGNLTREGSNQVLSFANVGGILTIDPLEGSDVVAVNGTAQSDAITAIANSTTTVQVNALKTVNLPISNVELLAINSGHSVDSINITTIDSVNANLFVDAGEPTANKKNGDLLSLKDGSGKAKLLKKSGGPAPNTGSILVTYPRTTGNATQVDYTNTENIKIIHN